MCRTPRSTLRSLVVALVLVMWGSGGWVVADDVPHRTYTTFDGLPSASITALAQSANGLLWVGTNNGLAVYDGTTFRTIAVPDSIAAKPIQSLLPRPDGSVWVGTHLGPMLKVRPSGVQRIILPETAALARIVARGDTVLFVTARAVWHLPPGAERPTRQPFQYDVRPPSEVETGAPPDVGVGARDAAVRPNGQLWILDGRRGPGRVRSDGSVTFGMGSNAPPGRLWSGLRFAADGTGVLAQGRTLYRMAATTHSLDGVTDTLRGPGTRLDAYGDTVYVRQRRRVLRYDPTRHTWLPALGPARGLPDASPTVVLRTREDGLWMGTREGLVHVMAPGGRHVTAMDGSALQYVTRFMGREEHLWAASWGSGLLQLRPTRRRVVPEGKDQWVPLRSRDDYLHALSGSDGGWYRWAPSSGWTRVASVPNAVRGFVDATGTGFFWHDDGVYRQAPAASAERTQWAAWPMDERGHHVLALAPNGDPILRARPHILRLRPAGERADTLASVPEHASATGVHAVTDPSGRLWCAFTTGGLLRVDLDTGQSRLLLRRTAVENVRAVGDSLLVASTHDGLYLLDPERATVRRHLTHSDGLLSNVTNAGYLTDDTLYVAHPSGLSVIPREVVRSAPSSPPSLLADMEVNLDDRARAGDSVLAASERTVGFSYTAPELTHPDRIRYEVRLQPREKKWRATSRDFTRYTNLDPGTYRFEVRARVGDAPPGPTATYEFVIPPHLYETWWFQLVVVLALLGVGGAAYRWRTQQMRQRQETLEAAVESRTEELAAEKRRTERQAERLAELDATKNRFFAHVSHEFRTPLSLILTPLEEAVRCADTDTITFGQRHVERMLRNARRLHRLIDRLLDLATLEAGAMELERAPGDLAAFVRRAVEAFASMAEYEGVALHFEGPEDEIETRFDPDKMESIVSNLVSNAIKFTPEGGRVRVRLGRRATATDDGAADEEAVLTVSDTGPGIDAETQADIFKRYERVHDADTPARDGIGLGLALTKELVDLHGGRIDVESTSGEGATFVVRIPLVPAREAEVDGARAALPDAMSPVMAGGNGARDGTPSAETDRPQDPTGEDARPTILVVEDHPEMRTFLCEQLRDRWQIRLAENGVEGWRRVQENPPDLVLSDVMMPEMDGVELCARIKDDDTLQTVPVILLTARSETGAAVEGLRGGADDYLEKPFDVTELRQRIDSQLTARRRLRDRYRQEVHLDTLDVTVDEDDVSFVDTVTEVVEANLHDPDFTVERIAEAVALSKRQLTRRLKSIVGRTPAAFVRERRIKRAKTLLANDPDTIAEVAYAVGFRSPSAFSKTFREREGMTPSSFMDEKGSEG